MSIKELLKKIKQGEYQFSIEMIKQNYNNCSSNDIKNIIIEFLELRIIEEEGE